MLDNEPNERQELADTDHSADSPVTDEATPKRRRTRKSAVAAAAAEEPATQEPAEKPARRRRKAAAADTEPETSGDSGTNDDVAPKTAAPAHSVLFMAPSPVAAVVPVVQDIDADSGETPTRRRRRRSRAGEAEEAPEP